MFPQQAAPTLGRATPGFVCEWLRYFVANAAFRVTPLNLVLDAMVEAEVSIWIASKTRWVHLSKPIQFQALPRVGEYLKLKNDRLADYFAWKVTEITHREPMKIEVSTELLDNIENRMYSFEDEEEFDEYYDAYVQAGWTAPQGVSANTQRGGV